MFNKIAIFVSSLLLSASVFAVGPGQIWRLSVTESADGAVQISEIELNDSTGTNVVDLIKVTSFVEVAGSDTWTYNHNLSLQTPRTTVVVDAVTSAGGIAIEPSSVSIDDENTVTVTFSEPAIGSMTVTGSTFDSPASTQLGTAVPVIENFTDRPAAAAFDGNAGSSFKSRYAPTTMNPLVLQYTFWLGQPSRFPNVASYSIQVPFGSRAPASWTLEYWDQGTWYKADQRAGVVFEDGEKKTYYIAQ